MTSGLMVRALLETAQVLGQGGDCPREAIFSCEGSQDDRVDICDILLLENIDFDELPESLQLGRQDILCLNRKFQKIWQWCQRTRVVFRDPRGTGIDLAGRLGQEQAKLLQLIIQRLGLSYELKKLTSGMGVMQLILDISDLFGVNEDTPCYLYLNYHQGCVGGTRSFGPSFASAILAVEARLNPVMDTIKKLSEYVWRLALAEKVAVIDETLTIKIDLNADFSPELEITCHQLIQLLAATDETDETKELPGGSHESPEIGEGPALEPSDPVIDEIRD